MLIHATTHSTHSVLGQPSDPRRVAAPGCGLPGSGLFGFVGRKKSSWHLCNSQLWTLAISFMMNVLFKLNGQLRIYLHVLCFTGCLVVSRNWHFVVLASMGVCVCLRKYLAFCHLPSACVRLPNVSPTRLHQFESPPNLLRFLLKSFSLYDNQHWWNDSEQRVFGPGWNRGHGAVPQLHRRSSRLHWQMAAWRKTHLPESFFTGMSPPPTSHVNHCSPCIFFKI